MFGLTAKVNQRDINNLNGLLTMISVETGKRLPSLVKQTAKFAVYSAAKATKPGNTGKINNLDRKFRLRPIVGMSSMVLYDSYFYQKLDHPNEIFKLKHVLSDQSLKKAKLKRVIKAIQYWKKQTGGWGLLPYTGDKNDYDDSVKSGRIPHAAAAKWGWVHAADALTKISTKEAWGELGMGGPPPRAILDHRILTQISNNTFWINIINEVSYVSNIAPSSAVNALVKAQHHMEKIYLPKLSQELQNKWRS